MRAISNDFLMAVLIVCLPNDQNVTLFAKSCNLKFFFFYLFKLHDSTFQFVLF